MGFFASTGILNQRGFFSAPVSAAPPAPSGIPVASTASVVISGNGFFNGTYAKKVPEQALIINSNGHNSYLETGTCYLEDGSGIGSLLLSPDAQVWDDEIGAILGSPFGAWRLIADATFDVDSDSWVSGEFASNASTDANYIPTSGWSPTITITAA